MRGVRIVIGALVIVGIAAVVFSSITGREVGGEALEAYVREFGLIAPLVYLLLFAVLGSLFVPTTVFAVLAVSLFGMPLAFFYALLGSVLSAVVGFWLARFLGRDFVMGWLGENPGKLTRLDAVLREKGFWAALMMRLVYLPCGLTNAVCGLSGIHPLSYLMASALGLSPIVFAVTYMASGATEAVNGGGVSSLFSGETTFAFGLLLCCIATPFVINFIAKLRGNKHGLWSGKSLNETVEVSSPNEASELEP
jgi:uncharacterized membrane protein YdjX (TVP38/TMEM64 family)